MLARVATVNVIETANHSTTRATNGADATSAAGADDRRQRSFVAASTVLVPDAAARHETQAVVADELELVRVGLAAILEPLGVGVCGEARSGREAAELAAFALPDLVIVGRVSDGSTHDALKRVVAVKPRPCVVALFAVPGDPDIGRAHALGVEGLALRSGSLIELADVVERVLKHEPVIVPALQPSLAGALHLAAGAPPAAQPDGALPYGALSGRELEMLGFLAQGRTNREIAAVLSLSLATVKTHLVRLYSKLGVGSRSEALARAAALGLLR